MDLTLIASCVPDNVHWFSQQILDYYVNGRISTGEFLRWFHMPNSDYISLAQCVVTQMDPFYSPSDFQPGILDGYMTKPCPKGTPDCVS